MNNNNINKQDEFYYLINDWYISDKKQIITSTFEGVLEKLTNDDEEEIISEKPFTIQIISDESDNILVLKILKGNFNNFELNQLVKALESENQPILPTTKIYFYNSKLPYTWNGESFEIFVECQK